MHTHPNTESSFDNLYPRVTAPSHPNILRLSVAAKHLQIAEATFRQLRFESEERKAANGRLLPGNGFAKAFMKLGRAVYVDVPVFLEIWRAQQLKEASHD